MRATQEHSASRNSQRSREWAAFALLFFVLSTAIFLVLQRDQNFFLRDDFENQYLGGYAEIVRALNAGELPLLTPLSWQAGALAGEYQYAVFNPVLQSINFLLFGLDLPLPNIAAILVWIYAFILSSGTFVLARSKGIEPWIAVMAALVTTMNGWMILWGVNWFPALSSFAWVPWTWWALERALSQRGRPGPVLLAGVLVALILTSGWPFTCLMTVLIAITLMAKIRAEKEPYSHSLPVVLSGLLGAGLAAPAWLTLVEYSSSTLRGQHNRSAIFQPEFIVPLKAQLGMILPTLNSAWNIPWNPAPVRNSFVMHVGLAPIAILVTAAIVMRSQVVHRLKKDFFFLLALLALVSLPSLGMFRWSFRWLPLFFLHLALVAGRADSLVRAENPSKTRYGPAAFFLVAASSAYSLLFESNTGTVNLWFCAGLSLIGLLWWLAENTRHVTPVRDHLPWIVVFATSILLVNLLFHEVRPRPRVHVPREEKLFDPEITYLAAYSEKDRSKNRIPVYGQRFYPGNDHLYSNLRFINGYSPMFPAGTTRRFGFDYIGSVKIQRLLPLGKTLARMAVDGLVLWPETDQLELYPLDEFEKVASTPDFDVYHRRSGRTSRVQVVREAFIRNKVEKIWHLQTAEPPALERQTSGEERRATFGQARLLVREDTRLRVVVDVDASETNLPVLVSFARPWYPGYRAFVDGRATEVGRLEGLMPTVEVPPGRNFQVVLEYRPRSFIVGVALAAFSLLVVLWVLVFEFRKRRRQLPG